MIIHAKSLLAVGFAFIAPILYYVGNNLRIPESEVTATSPEISRLQSYLQIRTDHPNPAYYEATRFLNHTVRALIPSASVAEHSFKPGKPVLLVSIAGIDPALPAVLLNSHMDVVPVEPLKWKHEPFAALIAYEAGEARIYARGSQDMKSVGLSYIEALAKLLQTSWRPTRNVHVLFVPDEEIGGMEGMGALVSSDLFPKLNVGVVLDEGIPHAERMFNVFYGERQTWVLHISARGKPGHGATLPHMTATQMLHTVLGRVLAFRETQHARVRAGADLGDVVNVNVAYMRSGQAAPELPAGYIMNVIPSEAHLGLDIRIPPSVAKEDMEAELNRWLTCDDGKRCPGVSKRFTLKVDMPHTTSRDPAKNPYITPFGNGLRHADIDDRLRHGIFFASTDSRYLRDVGIPCFGFSPIENTPNLLHKHNEYISVVGYLRGITIYKNIIKEMADFVDPHAPATGTTQTDDGMPTSNNEVEMDEEEEDL